MIKTLYHFTCDHGYSGITSSGLIRANPRSIRGLGPVVWLTDLALPTVDEVGLTSEVILKCDRMAYRYIVHTRAAVSWAAARARVDPQIVVLLERYGAPDHWFVVRRGLTPSEFAHDTSYTRNPA